VDLALSKVLAVDGKYYPDIVRIILQDSAGNPAIAPVGGITVTLSSSAKGIGTVESSVTISEGEFFTNALFRTTATPGSTTIKAIATIGGVTKTDSKTMTTISPTANPPKSIKVEVLPKITSLSEFLFKEPVVVYLVDAGGNPAKALGRISVSLSSSDSLVGIVSICIPISKDEIYGFYAFTSTWRPGTTIITATVAGLTSGSATVTTGVFTPRSKTYTFANLGYLFYSTTILVPGHDAHAREVMGTALISYALSKAGAQIPLIKTDGLINSTEYAGNNLIITGFNNTKTTAKNTEYGIIVETDTTWFNITSTSEGLSLNLPKAEYPSKSIAIVYLKKDGTRAVMLVWGYGWLGTYVAELFMADPNNWSKPAIANKHLLMLSWTDTNSDGFVQSSEITIASTA